MPLRLILAQKKTIGGTVVVGSQIKNSKFKIFIVTL